MERRSIDNGSRPRPFRPGPFGPTGAPARTSARPPTQQRKQAEVVQLPRGRQPGLRYVNTGLGVWLFISAFLWPHGPASFANTWIVGLLLAVTGLFVGRVQGAQLLSGGLAAWLVLSTLAIVPRTELTFWHNLLVGLLAFVATFVPAARRPRRATSRAD